MMKFEEMRGARMQAYANALGICGNSLAGSWRREKGILEALSAVR